MSALPRAKIESVPKRVLVVEDDAVIRLLVADAMRDAGLFVIEACSGAAALDYLASGGPVDIVFSDIEMSGAPDGLQLARDIRAAYQDLPVILTTGSVKPLDLKDAEAFIAKPYQIAHVLALVAATLGAADNGTK